MTADRSDLYAVLGLTPRATAQEIRRAYRELLRRNHPDTRPVGEPGDSEASDATLQRAVSAYSTLGDEARRAVYDHRTTHPTPPPPIRVHRVQRFQQRTGPEQPPILAGPVRWHASR